MLTPAVLPGWPTTTWTRTGRALPGARLRLPELLGRGPGPLHFSARLGSRGYRPSPRRGDVRRGTPRRLQRRPCLQLLRPQLNCRCCWVF